MVSLQKLPDELQNFIAQHRLMRADVLATEPPAPLQQALTQVIGLTMRGFAELAGQASNRDTLWNAAREAAAAGPGATTTLATGGTLLRKVLHDRYHGTVSAAAAEAGVAPTTISYLLELVPAAALTVVGNLVAEQHWTAQQLAEWLRPRQHAPVPLPILRPQTIPTAVPRARASSWFAKPAHVLLVVMSVVAAAEFGYILSTRFGGDDAEMGAVATSTPTVGPAIASETAANQYAAMPVANQLATSPKTVVPAVLKLKNGVHQISGASSAESKLYQFLMDPGKEADSTDPTKGWIGLDRIYFNTNKATLTNESLWQLSNIANILKRFPTAKIKISGYTGSSDESLTNLLLSKHRAEAAKEVLVSLGLPTDRLVAVGYGVLGNSVGNDAEESRTLGGGVSLQVTQK